MEEEFSQKVVRNTVFNGIGSFWNAVVAFLLTPYIIHRIGLERFGIWALVEITLGYIRLFDIGIVHYTSLYIARCYAKNDPEGINKVVNTALVFYFLLGICLFSFGLFLILPLLHLCKVPHPIMGEAAFIFIIALAIATLSNLMGAFTAVLYGLQRMGILNAIDVAISIPMAIGTVVALHNGLGLAGLAVNSLIIFVFTVALTMLFAKKVFPALRINPFLAEWDTFIRLTKIGSKVQITRIGNIIISQADKVIISHFLNIRLLSFYQLASGIIAKAKELPFLLVSAIVPLASELDEIQDKRRLRELYLRGTKYLMLLGVPLFIFISLQAQAIFYFWMGQIFKETVQIIRILALCYSINILPIIGQNIAFGIGKPGPQMKTTIAQAILTIVLGIFLVNKIGLIGFIVAACTALTLASFWFTIIFHREMHYGLPLLKPILVIPIVSSLISAVFASLVTYFLRIPPVPTSRLSSFCIILFNALLFFTPYLIIIIKNGAIDTYDRTVFLKQFMSLKKILSPVRKKPVKK